MNRVRPSFHILGLMLLSMFLFGCSVDEGMKTPSQVLYQPGPEDTFYGPTELFTGKVKVDMLFPQNEHTTFSGAYVTFQPCARTAWHLHPGGQHMVVVSGVCLTGTRDGKVISFKEGETVWCPPDLDHWHGATPENPMTHLVITGSRDNKNVIWKEKVTDEQYFGTGTRKEQIMSDVAALTDKQQAMIPIAGFAAAGDLKNLSTAIHEGLDSNLTVNEVKEILIHLYAYAGFPRSLNGISTLMSVLEERRKKGIKDKTGRDATPLPSTVDFLNLGEKTQTQLVGKPVAGALYEFAPAIDQFLKSHLFGAIFARDVLDHKSREIVTVSALSCIDGVDSQLKAHLFLSRNAGVTTEQLQALVEVLKRKACPVEYDVRAWITGDAM